MKIALKIQYKLKNNFYTSFWYNSSIVTCIVDFILRVYTLLFYKVTYVDSLSLTFLSTVFVNTYFNTYFNTISQIVIRLKLFGYLLQNPDRLPPAAFAVVFLIP